MTKVLEVSTAEDVTGHLNSLAVTAPDRVTFVKGTCPEEAKWWLNILSAFPKTKVKFLSRLAKEFIIISMKILLITRVAISEMPRFPVVRQRPFYKTNVSKLFFCVISLFVVVNFTEH